jgi:anti-sigma regulatory factor (Ser/Thr protein kinase)
MTGTRRFPCRPESVTAARRFVRDILREHPLDIVEAAELLTSELASNCVRHAHTAFELAVDSREEIRIEVRDTGEGRPELRSPSPRDPSGRGLRIVEAMASAWGISPSAGGKVVWFTLAEQSHAPADGRESEARSDPGATRSSPGWASAVSNIENRAPARSRWFGRLLAPALHFIALAGTPPADPSPGVANGGSLLC